MHIFSYFCTKKVNTRIIQLDEVGSTNEWLRENAARFVDDCVVAVADFQTAGRGCGTNSWESERGKNLLLSILVKPKAVTADGQFALSMAGSVAMKAVLDGYTNGIALKWPNDVYWKDRKLSGTLIECSLSGRVIKSCIFGIGLNVNQRVFTSDAPNPVSLCQILGREVSREPLLNELVESLIRHFELVEHNPSGIAKQYAQSLYRREGYHWFRDRDGAFEAHLVEVEPSGRLRLADRSGQVRSYAFKEVEFII